MPNPFKLNPPCLCRVLLRRRLEGRADKNVMDVIIKDIKVKGRLKTRYIDFQTTFLMDSNRNAVNPPTPPPSPL